MTRHKRAHSAGVLPKAKSVRKTPSFAVNNTNTTDDEVVADGSQPQSQSYLDPLLSQPSVVTDELFVLDDSQMCMKNLQAHLAKLSKTVIELKEIVRKQQAAINQLYYKVQYTTQQLNSTLLKHTCS